MAQISTQVLARLDLFRGLSADELQTLAGACAETAYAAGDVILQEGAEYRALWVLLEGTAEVDLEVPKVGDKVIAELHAPSIFGETSFFHAGPHSATVKSATATRLLKLERLRFDQLAGENPAVALRLAVKAAEILAARSQQTDRWVESMLENQMDAKVSSAWRHFRESMGHGLSTPGPFVGLGANWE